MRTTAPLTILFLSKLILVSIFSTMYAGDADAATEGLCSEIFGGIPVADFLARDTHKNDQHLRDIKEELDLAELHADDHFSFLKRIGLRKNQRGEWTLDLNLALENIQKEIERAIGAGQIRRDQALVPIRIYQKKPKNAYDTSTDKTLLFLSPGEAVPDGYAVFTDLLPSDDFYKLLASGKFPIGEVIGLRTQEYSLKEGLWLHEINHFSAMMSDYRYMAQVRQAANLMSIETGVRTSDVRRLNYQKYEYFVEFLTLIDPVFQKETLDQVGKIKAQLGLKEASPYAHREYVSAVIDAIRTADETTRQNIMNLYTLTTRPNYWLPLGGAVRPVEMRYGSTEILEKVFRGASLMLEHRPDLVLRLATKAPKASVVLFRDIEVPMGIFLVEMELLAELHRDEVFTALFSDMKTPSPALEDLCRRGFSNMICSFLKRDTK